MRELGARKGDVQKTLVVARQNIVFGLPAPDQIGFHDQGFQHRAADDVFDRADVRQKLGRLRVFGPRPIRTHAPL